MFEWLNSEKRGQVYVVAFVVFALALLTISSTVRINLPGVNTGYMPQQPIQFSHRLHSGDLQIPCLYCHTAADKSQHASIPPVSVCMNCHRFVTAGWDMIKIEEKRAKETYRSPQIVVSDEITKLYKAAGFNSESMKYERSSFNQAIEWVRVHNLPDFVFFDHSRHINAGVTCQHCHGAVETMERVMQQNDLTMGWCVNCHRDVNNGRIPELKGRYASISCTVCHY